MKSVVFVSELVTYELLIDCLLIDPSSYQGPASKNEVSCICEWISDLRIIDWLLIDWPFLLPRTSLKKWSQLYLWVN